MNEWVTDISAALREHTNKIEIDHTIDSNGRIKIP